MTSFVLFFEEKKSDARFHLLENERHGEIIELIYGVTSSIMYLELSVFFSKQGKRSVRDTRTFLQVGSPFDANPDANGQKTP